MGSQVVQFCDDTPMPFGKKKGQRLGDISDGYLLTLYDRTKVQGFLKEYIENRIPVLQAQLRLIRKRKNNE